MGLWTDWVQWVTDAVLALSGLYGGSVGLAVVTLSFAVRLALLPLSLRLARRSREQRARLAALKPELEALQRRLKAEPERLAQETLALYRAHGVAPVDGRGLLALLAQAPVVGGLVSALSRGRLAAGPFLWMADLARPDVLLLALVACLSGAGAALNPDLPREGRTLMVLLPAALSVLFLWRASAALGLYWAASSGVGLLQSALLRRAPARSAQGTGGQRR
ncbi:membrane protein insertase YidC [Aggregicoccus sp. 17bor-14]|uniref:membrane protein insertase YidC n=1 Tax=Myxococcaceae TaxID=31 RepID=UPI00129C907D|nr:MULTISPECIES: membrane protein insertase YidC [Myxococcaceae]MBF5043275.1 membrane protein insertase YidC [Simulacricoccus sp. 17bor-14]MRI89032.1 membrane protein insertase YidC [Aggregicoccus sp. 17bor-14]